jgi:hypothetical protein
VPRSPDPQTVQLHRQPRVRLMRFNSACAGSAADQAVRHHSALRSSGTSPNLWMTVASRKSPVAGSPLRLKAMALVIAKAPRPKRKAGWQRIP